MSCLSVIQTACLRMGLNSPGAVVSSTDPQTKQMLALLNEEGQTLAEATNWQALTTEASFTTVATEIQGALTTIAPNCKFIVNDTIWNRTLRMPVFGPLAAQTWQQQKAMYLQGPWNQFRLVNGQIKFLPTPAAGQSCYFEYVTKNWTDGATDTFTTDTQSALLDESVMVMGLIWRFRAAKGLDYSADLEKYSRRVSDLIGRETPKAILDMGDSFNDIPPVVILPAGSWGGH
jgi:hypothetical protein